MTFIELAKKAWPGATDELADAILWNRTPFPFDKSPRVLFKAIAGARRAAANGRQLCEFCNWQVADGWCCNRCKSSLAPNDNREGGKG